MKVSHRRVNTAQDKLASDTVRVRAAGRTKQTNACTRYSGFWEKSNLAAEASVTRVYHKHGLKTQATHYAPTKH